MKKRALIFTLAFLVYTAAAIGQEKLKPGFDANEYGDMLKITARQMADTNIIKPSLPYPDKYIKVFRSDSLGLDNLWEFWLRDDSVAVISIRGTVMSSASWLEDFYAAMVPAEGYLTLSKTKVFDYKLASDTNAFVHTGFLLGLAYLAPSITEKINEFSARGVKEYIIMGHSQGGAIAYMLTSYLHYLSSGVIPGDVKFKTYCSAPPKPGNIFYAYDFEYITRGGWSYRVVNVLDWVPQMPFTVQTEFDLRADDPIPVVDTEIVARTNYFVSAIIGYLQKSVLETIDDARDVLIKYLGKGIYPFVKKFLPDFKEPRYSPTQYYMTCGSPVILKPKPEYNKAFPKRPGVGGLFSNHLLRPYYFLLKQEYLNKE